MEAKIKTQKIPGPKIHPPKFHARIFETENSLEQKGIPMMIKLGAQ